jgi:hypothetical protein
MKPLGANHEVHRHLRSYDCDCRQCDGGIRCCAGGATADIG